MSNYAKLEMKLDLKPFLNALKRLEQEANIGVREALEVAGRDVMKSSLQQVPRETNALADSAFFRSRKYRDNQIVTVGYGAGGGVNPKTGQAPKDYMVAVHEDLSANHPRGGKAKFLEDPINEYGQKFGQETADLIRRRLERGK